MSGSSGPGYNANNLAYQAANQRIVKFTRAPPMRQPPETPRASTAGSDSPFKFADFGAPRVGTGDARQFSLFSRAAKRAPAPRSSLSPGEEHQRRKQLVLTLADLQLMESGWRPSFGGPPGNVHDPKMTNGYAMLKPAVGVDVRESTSSEEQHLREVRLKLMKFEAFSSTPAGPQGVSPSANSSVNSGSRAPFLRRNLPDWQAVARTPGVGNSNFVVPRASAEERFPQCRKRKLDRSSEQNSSQPARPADNSFRSSSSRSRVRTPNSSGGGDYGSNSYRGGRYGSSAPNGAGGGGYGSGAPNGAGGGGDGSGTPNGAGGGGYGSGTLRNTEPPQRLGPAPRPSKYPRIYRPGPRLGERITNMKPPQSAGQAIVARSVAKTGLPAMDPTTAGQSGQGKASPDIEQGYAPGDSIIILRSSGIWQSGWIVSSIGSDGLFCTKGVGVDMLSKLIPKDTVHQFLKPKNVSLFQIGDSVRSNINGSLGKVVTVSEAGVVNVYWPDIGQQKCYAKEVLARCLDNRSQQERESKKTEQAAQSSSSSSSSHFSPERPQPRVELANNGGFGQQILRLPSQSGLERVKAVPSSSWREAAQSSRGGPSGGVAQPAAHQPAAVNGTQPAAAGYGHLVVAARDRHRVVAQRENGPPSQHFAFHENSNGSARRSPANAQRSAALYEKPPLVNYGHRGAQIPVSGGGGPLQVPSRLARRRAPVLHSLDAFVDASQHLPPMMMTQQERVRQSVASALLARRVSASKPAKRVLPEEARASQKRQQAVIQDAEDTPVKLHKATEGSSKSTAIDLSHSSSSSDAGDSSSSDEEPATFCCPISCEIMKDPVLAEDGQTYERDALQRWFTSGNTTSPITRGEISPEIMIPNYALKSLIAGWRQKCERRKKAKLNAEEDRSPGCGARGGGGG